MDNPAGQNVIIEIRERNQYEQANTKRFSETAGLYDRFGGGTFGSAKLQ
jgi:hypothetical protein